MGSDRLVPRVDGDVSDKPAPASGDIDSGRLIGIPWLNFLEGQAGIVSEFFSRSIQPARNPRSVS